ncbi:DUF3263 domain-containing protein [Mycobacterium gordonae]|uniref:DUF3263 domain-containing protein n=1 Tax=Mycobacterium gordonae TaxID=1778 RepID=UPI0035569529
MVRYYQRLRPLHGTEAALAYCPELTNRLRRIVSTERTGDSWTESSFPPGQLVSGKRTKPAQLAARRRYDRPPKRIVKAPNCYGRGVSGCHSCLYRRICWRPQRRS